MGEGTSAVTYMLVKSHKKWVEKLHEKAVRESEIWNGGVEKMTGSKPGRSTIAPTANEENLANKILQLTGLLQREMIPSQAVMHYNHWS